MAHRGKSPQRMRRFESAQLVWDALTRAGDEGLTFREIEAKTDLTRGQIIYALGLIKETLMEANKQPLAYNHVTWKYSLPPEWNEVSEYIDFRVAGIVTMVRRVEHVANASVMKWGDEPLIQDVMMRVRLLRRDLEVLASRRDGGQQLLEVEG